MNNNMLPTDQEDMSKYIYYVYRHLDPRTGELLYVGHGCRGRAWIHGSKRTCLRSKEHLDHLESMTLDGFIPTDWVQVLYSGLDKSSACQKEQAIIRHDRPKYNKPQGKQNLKVTPEIYDLCQALRKDGNSYAVVAEEVGLSPMTVYRALNNQTKNIGDLYGE